MSYQSVLSAPKDTLYGKIALLMSAFVQIYFLSFLLNNKKHKVSCLRNVCVEYHESNS